MQAISDLADEFEVPLADVLMIGLNAFGVQNRQDLGRARCFVRLDAQPDRQFRSIVASGRSESPYSLDGAVLLRAGERVGVVDKVEHDDARLGYFRRDKSVLTLNTNARSHCTGCVFCPNTGSEASDPKVDLRTGELEAWLRILADSNGMIDMSAVDEVNVSTSCFGSEQAAVEHLLLLRSALARVGFHGRLGILSSVIRSSAAFDSLMASGSRSCVFLTMECVSNRTLWLKQSKAELSPGEALDVLATARSRGCDTGLTLVVGLDPLGEMCDWLTRAIPHLSDFPNLQIFQVHSRFMASAGLMGEDPLRWFLEARRALEGVLAGRPDLRPCHWQNYRPFWYTTYRGEAL